MEKDIRNKQIYDLKTQGVSTLRIARHYGISSERVRRICDRLSNKELQSPPTSFAKALSPTIGRVLRNYWGTSEILNHPDIIVDLGAAGLSNLKRIGPKALQEIADNLQCFGYIDDPDFWLAEKRP